MTIRRKRAVSRRLTGSSWMALGSALSVSSLTVVFYVTGEAGVWLQVAFLSSIASTIFILSNEGAEMKQATPGYVFAFSYFLLCSLSTLLNIGSYTGPGLFVTFVDITNSSALLVLGALLSTGASSIYFDRIYSKVAVIIAVFLAVAVLMHWNERIGDRFAGNGIQPNWWGSVAFGSACCALFVRSLLLRTFVFFVVIFVCLETSSRGSLIAIAILLGAPYLYSLWSVKVILITLFTGALVFPFVLLSPLGNLIGSFIFDNILQIDNVYRGAGTGFTGRADQWWVAYVYFANSPLFGAGFGSLPQVHNGFLILLGETGVFGFSLLAILIISNLRRASDLRFRTITLSYCFFMLFAPRAFNLVLGSFVPSIVMMQGLRRRTEVNGSPSAA